MRKFGPHPEVEFVIENLAENRWFHISEDGEVSEERHPHQASKYVTQKQANFFKNRHDLGGRSIPLPDALCRPAAVAEELRRYEREQERA